MKKIFWGFVAVSILFLVPKLAFAVKCEGSPPQDDPVAIQNFIDACQSKIGQLQGTAKTLKAAIQLLNSKINLTTAQIRSTVAQIAQLEKDIQTLGGVIGELNVTLDDLTAIYLSRIRQTYKNRQTSSLILLFASDSFTTFQNKLKYLSIASKRDQIILHELESTRLDLDSQKTAKETKQQEVEKLKITLEEQKAILDRQGAEKKRLLADTQNSEAKYQNLLKAALAELEAIESIIAGKGTEQEVGDISSGQIIAKVIPSASCNSSGPHLHFIVARSSETQNPFNYLKPVDYRNCSGSSCGSNDGDSFNPSGSWDWPLNPTIKMNQGYGSTWATRNTWVGSIYKFHNGIDIEGSNNDIKAVQAGKLFRGSYSGVNGCALKYVRVDHKDTDLDTYYLHVNYF